MRIINYCFILMMVLFGVSFACLNAELVQVNIYVSKFSVPLSLLLVVVLGIGVLIGILLLSIKYIAVKSENIKLKNKIKRTEVTNLRAIPLKETL